MPKVVFLGKDKGNLPYLRSYIEHSGLVGQIETAGFVPSSHMGSIYRGSLAVVMPTYFGPTNLPPLEAWVFCKPLIYSSHLSEQAEDAALLVDPDSAEQLADAMYKVRDPNVQKALVAAGQTRLALLQSRRTDAEERFADILSRFSKRRQCWQ
jgi:glycosyltransferase involved in cell wall biosynthesis